MEPTRKVEIKNEEGLVLQNKIIELRKSAEPHIKKLGEMAEQNKAIVADMKALEEAELMPIENEAKEIAKKLTEIVKEEVMPTLGEFEEALNVDIVDGVLYANIFDAVERYKEQYRTRVEEAKKEMEAAAKEEIVTE